MKILYHLDLSEDALRAISGRRKPATRKEVREWLDKLVAYGVSAAAAEHQSTRASSRELLNSGPSKFSSCGPLDHLFPLGPKSAETLCFCGRRRWGGGRAE